MGIDRLREDRVIDMRKVTYISNAGVLVEIGNKKILIDSLCDSKVPIYKATPDEVKDKIVGGVPPFDGIDLMLFTHHHSDHFEPKSTAEFIKCQANVVLVSTGETIRRLKTLDPSVDESRLIVPDLQAGEGKALEINGIRIQVISMVHDGKDYQDVENFAYLLEVDEKRILHVGDAKPMTENYGHLNLVEQSIDLLLAPFPYVGIPAGQLVIANQIKPKKIAAIHLPYKEKDKFNWIEGTKKSFGRVREQFVETVFLEEIGETMVF